MASSVEQLNKLEINTLELLGIRSFLENSIVVQKYRVPNHLHEPIKLTERGEGYARRLIKPNQVLWGDARLACFLQYSYNGLLVDAELSDIDALRLALGREIVEGRIKHPFVFGRQLFDKAQAEKMQERSLLSPEATWQFLSDTPCGVFQVENVLVGPLGALRSREFRDLPSIPAAPIYLCESASCHQVHWTQLSTAEKLPIFGAREKLRKMLESEGSPGIRDESISRLSKKLSGFYDDTRSVGLVPLLGECFSRGELCELVRHAAKGADSELRAALAENSMLIQDVDTFLLGKDVPSLIQILLLLPDNSLTAIIDETVRSKAIIVPEYEIRAPKIVKVSTGHFDLSSEVSSLGVRYMSTEESPLPQLRLRNLVRELHDLNSAASQASLKWILRRTPGESLEEQLDFFLHNKPTRQIVIDLIIAKQENFLAVAQKYGLGSPKDLVMMEDEQLIDIILWKLGFEVPNSKSDASALRRFKNSFQQAAVASSYHGKQDREEIRGKSSNLFVALEKSLDATLCFTCWALCFDHWAAEPRFVYTSDVARRFTAPIVNSVIGPDQIDHHFDPGGKNSLAALIAGLGHVRRYLLDLSNDASKYLRTVNSSPDFTHETTVHIFPFNHTVPFLDLSRTSQTRILEHLESLTRSLTRGRVADVRNRLEHHRDDFPTQDELTSCASAIGEFLDIAEQSGLHPTWFVFESSKTDSAGRGEDSFVDYLGRRYTERIPSAVSWPEMLTLAPRLIVPSAIIDDSDIALRFSHGAKSEFTDMWQDWTAKIKLQSPAIEASKVSASSTVYQN